MVFFRVLSSKRISGFRVFSIAAVLLATSIFALADETGKEHVHEASESHKANVEKMLELMSVPQQVNNAAASVLQIYSATVSDSNTDPNVRNVVNVYQQEVTKVVNSVLSWNALKGTYIDSYAKKLTADDVAATISFLVSPSGERFVEAQQRSSQEIEETTTHLAEVDLAPAIQVLSKSLRDGLTRLEERKQ